MRKSGYGPMKEPDFPEIERLRRIDADLRRQKAMEMGLTPEQAAEHEKEHAPEREVEDGHL